ncbi:MAG: energy-coupling factor ABC transporter ATP-binding protein [Oscillospiraceae bacterium]|nr:energy-coupling factor ABC transporter ATP-binding protein [Oscillospiraceae bacterium]
MTAIEVKNLSFSYDGVRTVLHDVSFSVSEGEMFVIAGLSGCGKTTLCLLLCGLIPHSIKGKPEGDIRVLDIDPVRAGLPETALRAGLVFQDADSGIICTTVEDEVAFGPENLCCPPSEIRRRVDETLAEFGLEEIRRANPSRLSGGLKKLLTIASVSALAPPILILDEPMSDLDKEGRALVGSAIDRQRDRGRTVILVEHDLARVRSADRWLILDNGAVALYGAPSGSAEQQNLLTRLRLLP